MKIRNSLILEINENLMMRPLKKSDAEALYALVESNRAYLREFLGWVDYNKSVSDSLYFIEQEMDNQERVDGLTLGIFLKNCLVGVISLYGIDLLDQVASIGYWLAQQHQKKGIMLLATERLIQYAFETLSLHRLEVRCACHNKKSIQIPEKLGFTREARLKEALHHYGDYFDVYLYSLLNKKHKRKI